MDMLETMFAKQRELSKGYFEKGYFPKIVETYPPEMWEKQSVSSDKSDPANVMVLQYTRALMHEIIEIERECRFKFWDKDTKIDWDAIRREIIDCWHFLMDMSLMAGMSAEDVHGLYAKKHAINEKRRDSDSYSTTNKQNQPADDEHIKLE